MPKNKSLPRNINPRGMPNAYNPNGSIGTLDMAKVTDEIIELQEQKKHRKIENVLKKISKKAVNTEKEVVDTICYVLVDKYRLVKEKAEKEKIFSCLKYFKDRVNPNRHYEDKPGSEPERAPLYMDAIGYSPELVNFFLHETKIKADLGLRIPIKMSSGLTLTVTALFALFNAEYPEAEKIKVLKLLLDAKIQVLGDELINLIFLFGGGENNKLVEYICSGADLDFLRDDNKSVLSIVIEDEQLGAKESIRVLTFLLGQMDKSVQAYEKPLQAIGGVSQATEVSAKQQDDEVQYFSKAVTKKERFQIIKNRALITASSIGRLDIVKLLLESGASPLFIDGEIRKCAYYRDTSIAATYSRNALTSSVYHGQFSICVAMLAVLKTSANLSENNKARIQAIKNRALIYAISTYQSKMVYLLLENGANPTCQKIPALHLALDMFRVKPIPSETRSGGYAFEDEIIENLEMFSISFSLFGNPLKLNPDAQKVELNKVLKYLIQRKYRADFGSFDKYGRLPLSLAAVIPSRDEARNAIELLLNAGANPLLLNEKANILHPLFIGGNLELAPLFGVLPNYMYYGDRNCAGFLHFLIVQADSPTITAFYKKNNLNIHALIQGTDTDLIPIPALMAAVQTNSLEKIKALIELGADITQTIVSQDNSRLITLFENRFIVEMDDNIFVFLYSEFLYKKLSAPRMADPKTDPIMVLANLIAQYKPNVTPDGSMVIKVPYISDIKKLQNHSMLLPIDKILPHIQDAVKEGKEINIKEILDAKFKLSSDYVEIEEVERAKSVLMEISSVINKNELNHQNIQGSIAVIQMVLDSVESMLEEMQFILTQTEEMMAGAEASNKDINAEKVLEMKQQIENLSKKLASDKNLFKSQIKFHKEQQEKASLNTNATDDGEKLKKEKQTFEILETILKTFKDMRSKVVEFKEQVELKFSQMEELKVKINNRITTLNEKDSQKQKERALKQAKEREEREKARKKALDDKLKLDEEKKKTTEKLKHSALLVLNHPLQLKKKAERMFDASLYARKISADLDRGFFGADSNMNRSALRSSSASLTMDKYLPPSLHSNVGVEFGQLTLALRELKGINPDSIKTSAENEAAEQEFQRRALLGMLARIMEWFVQKNLSPANTDIAQRFRDVVYHGDLFPRITFDKLDEAKKLNAEIMKMAEELLALLNDSKAVAKGWQETSKTIKSSLFHKIVGTKIVVNTNKDFYLTEIEAEERLIQKFAIYQNSAGIYAHLESASIICDHALGLTYGILGANTAMLRDNFPNEYRLKKEIYSEYIKSGKNYRHVKKAQPAAFTPFMALMASVGFNTKTAADTGAAAADTGTAAAPAQVPMQLPTAQPLTTATVTAAASAVTASAAAATDTAAAMTSAATDAKASTTPRPST